MASRAARFLTLAATAAIAAHTTACSPAPDVPRDVRPADATSDAPAADAPSPDVPAADAPAADVVPVDSGPRPPTAMGIVVQSPFNTAYTAYDLGVPEGLDSYITAGCLIDRADTNTMYVIQAGMTGGRIQAIALRRGSDGHILGFNGMARQVATTPSNVFGGGAYGEGNVALYASTPAVIGQWPPGAAMATETNIASITTMGPEGFPQGLAFVPRGFVGAGGLRALYSSGWFARIEAMYSGGRYTFTAVRPVTMLSGGAMGFVPTGSPLIPRPSLLVSGEGADVYELDAMGDPAPATRRPFLRGSGLTWGVHFDPVTGDFLFTNVQRHVIVVWGFAIPG